MVSLNRQLKAARIKSGFTLRQVEERLNRKITDGYLSVIERGRIECPNPHHLRALCGLYQISYLKIMMSAGYIKKKDLR